MAVELARLGWALTPDEAMVLVSRALIEFIDLRDWLASSTNARVGRPVAGTRRAG